MKALLDYLRNSFSGRPTPHAGRLPIYVRCTSCGEGLTTEINLQNDLSVEYGSSVSKDRYHTHKTIIGSGSCFQRIEVDLHFDSKKRIVKDEIHGGIRIDKHEYEELISGSAKTD